KGGFAALESSASGIRIDGEQRGAALVDFNHDGRIDLAVSQHDGPARLFLNQRARPGLRVTLQGSQANPASIGTQLRLVYAGQRLGPARAVVGAGGAAGTSTWVLGLDGLPDGIQVRWPDGHQETRLLSPETREITITRK
ncbi:MAG: hypothetical protein L6Q38_14690, partial [Nitrospira sp.]|nr:hypothetical protein [Nitrospira sp.]